MLLSTELPLSIVDGFTRTLLLCNLTPKPIITHTSTAIVSFSWTLLLSSLVFANGDLFITSMFSFLELMRHPSRISMLCSRTLSRSGRSSI
ncbi:hypothetical protein C8R48DRAFT_776020 [Suillus tomentosus]|nr:hypothetical protein C8R48DRAFT_776020 [Suillus tomentosus]